MRPVGAALAVAFGLAFAPAAHAAPYPVDFCKVWETDAPAAVLGGLSAYGTNAILVNGCGAGGAGGAIGLTVAGSTVGFNQSVGLALSVPADRPNLTIGRLWSVFRLKPRASGSDAFLELLANDQRLAAIVYPVAPAGQTEVPDQRALPAGTRTVRWSVFCSTSASTNCSWPDPGVEDLAKARLFLDEAVNPTLTVTGGTLVSPGAKAGNQSVTLDASDVDSGVASATVTLGTTVVGSVQFTCAFNDWSACQRDQIGRVLAVDTTKVPDGNHELFVTVRDAASNVLTRSLGLVTVANGGVPVPNGGSASRLAKITARFTSTRRKSLRLRFGSTPAVAGSLLDESGRPISGATVAILARPRQSGARPVQVATAQTGADGGFSTKLPSGPSRTITFAYTAFSNDAKPATTAVLRTSVRANLSARVAPRSVRAGKSIVVSGKLGPLARRKIEIKIQARQGSAWRTIDDVRTTRSGSFRWRYRFAATQARRTYAFRARVESLNYPFSAANSKAVLVRVR